MSVRRAQREIDSAEFSEWQAIYALDPFGEQRADLRAGTISATIATALSRRRIYRPRDFMFYLSDRQRVPAQMLAIKLLLASFAGDIPPAAKQEFNLK